MEKSLSIAEIQKVIPHRYPFLLVDKILELEAGKKAVGLKNVTANEPYFQGHFPGEPLMPGVLLVEAMAQVGAVALLSKGEFKGKLALFRGIEKCRFRGMVRPGDTLIIEVSLTALKSSVGRGKGTVRCSDRQVASAELIFALVFPSDIDK